MLSRRNLTFGLLTFPISNALANNVSLEDYKVLRGLESYKNSKIKVTGIELNIDFYGDENLPPLIVLHKLGGRIEEWRRLIPNFIKSRHVIAIDLPGHGKSRTFSPPPYIVTQEEIAAMIMSVVEHLGLSKPVSILGSSIGGCVALVCASLWPNRVDSVYTVGSAFNGSTSIANIEDQSIKAINDGYFDENDFPIDRKAEYARDVFGVYDRAVAAEMNISRRLAGNWINPLARGVSLYDYLSVLPHVENKVYLYHGTRGNYGKFHKVAHKLLPNSFMRSIVNSGAFPHEELPNELWQYLIKDLA